MTTYNVKSGLNTQITLGGQSVLVIPANVAGGLILNPANLTDQNTYSLEPLYLSIVKQPGLIGGNDVTVLWPGQSFTVPANLANPIFVNAATSGHRFTAYYLTIGSNYPPTPIPSIFPPIGYTTMTNVIPSYLYQEYNDDDTLQTFVNSYNSLGQDFIDTLNDLNLPIYSRQNIWGLLLDWVGQGIYGIKRPILAFINPLIIGPLNTCMFDTMTFNGSHFQGPEENIVTTDDIYRRVLTWALFKGDGKIVNIRWLKRRIMRFLIGTDGTNPNIDQTYQISITFGPNHEVAIKFIDEITTRTTSAIFNNFQMNSMTFNEQDISVEQLTPLPFRDVFQEAVQVGALEMPFQFNWNVYL